MKRGPRYRLRREGIEKQESKPNPGNKQIFNPYYVPSCGIEERLGYMSRHDGKGEVGQESVVTPRHYAISREGLFIHLLVWGQKRE